MVMASIEIKIPPAARDYVLDDTTDVMRNALLLYPSIANNTISHGRRQNCWECEKWNLLNYMADWGFHIST